MSRVLCIMGPTASGKTELARHLAAALPLDAVSVDSAQVYRGMDIGTAKPDPSFPHRLVDILDPDEPYSAARFRSDALDAIADIEAGGRIPMLVGGTMLYFRALFHGLAAMPPADADIRAEIEAAASADGWAALHAELAQVDPAAAARIHPNDPQRIQRALEVFRLTGTTISELQRRQPVVDGTHTFFKLAVAPADRTVLHRRIEDRFHRMVVDGLADEVASLRARYGADTDLPAMRAVGYRQMVPFLAGECDLEEAVEKGIHATRQLAKRQLTWLRSEPDVHWLDPEQDGWLDRGLQWASDVLC
jgi:tRNA dimethylallyltransferase